MATLYTWTALCAETKLIASYMVGRRDPEYAEAFISDLASRLANRVQLSTDGHRPYLDAVDNAFGGQIDYAMLVKIYGGAPTAVEQRRYSPAGLLSAEKREDFRQPRHGPRLDQLRRAPESDHAHGDAPVHAADERFQQKVQNLEHAVSLHFPALQLRAHPQDAACHAPRWQPASAITSGRWRKLPSSSSELPRYIPN